MGLEALRHGLTAAIDVDHDEWPDIVAAYGRCYYQQPHDQVMTQLGRDLAVLQHQIAVDQGERRPLLLKAAGQLSVIIALGLVASGQAIAARRWWHTARRVADESADPDAQIMVRAWDVVNGSYDGRPAVQVVAVSDEVLPLLDGRASAATCGLLAGRAQALSLAGRHAEAVATVQQLARMAEQLPATVVNDVESLWGWPEHRLRHTESWVYTHAANYRRAGEAQDRALALYPASQIRLRTQVELHRAAALIRTGHVPDGLRLAADLLDRLPTSQHNELVRSVARQVVVAVPDSERKQSPYRELLERVES
ncbi:XRE family transcriptional regulator [Micromonospora sp. NPDC051196]|uniref:XRE family transcriptional regulator n=1 Tax=Micromonospora sp. NPDC051196 TaxID=3155281 RepID=UPI00342E7E1F